MQILSRFYVTLSVRFETSMILAQHYAERHRLLLVHLSTVGLIVNLTSWLASQTPSLLTSLVLPHKLDGKNEKKV